MPGSKGQGFINHKGHSGITAGYEKVVCGDFVLIWVPDMLSDQLKNAAHFLSSG